MLAIYFSSGTSRVNEIAIRTKSDDIGLSSAEIDDINCGVYIPSFMISD